MNIEIDYYQKGDHQHEGRSNTWLGIDLDALIERMPETTRLEFFNHVAFDLAVSDVFLSAITGEHPLQSADGGSWGFGSHARNEIGARLRDLAPVAMVECIMHLASQLQFEEDHNRKLSRELHVLESSWDNAERARRGFDTWEHARQLTRDEVREIIQRVDVRSEAEIEKSSRIATALLEEVRARTEGLYEAAWSQSDQNGPGK